MLKPVNTLVKIQAKKKAALRNEWPPL